MTSAMMECGPFVLRMPFTALVSGASGSGKSTFTLKLLQSPHLFEQPVSEVLWFHGVNAINTPIGDASIRTFAGLPDAETLKHLSADGGHRILVLDDLMMELIKDKALLAALFTKYSHHYRLSILLLTQSLFDIPRIVRINTHYFVLFRSLSEKLNIQNLGKQLFPGKLKYFLGSFDDATTRNFGFLIISVHPREQNRCFTLATDVFSVPKLYLERE